MSDLKVFDEHILTGSESMDSILNRIIKDKKKNKKNEERSQDKQ